MEIELELVYTFHIHGKLLLKESLVLQLKIILYSRDYYLTHTAFLLNILKKSRKIMLIHSKWTLDSLFAVEETD